MEASASVQPSPSRKRPKKLLVQPYEFVIVVNFETTCWHRKAPPNWREPEIIEFCAVLMNLKTGTIEAEFHKFIRPTESPKLTAFCTKVTGIKQYFVDIGAPLHTTLIMFEEWLRRELDARKLFLPKMSKDILLGNCVFAIWTDWDFDICLDNECDRKRLRKPTFFNQWMDLRAIFRKWYRYKPFNFSDALRYVGMKFVGKERSGIIDARNLAELTYKMAKEGALLAITKDLSPGYMNLNF